MKTRTKKTATKTFMSGQGVIAQRYWKGASHWYQIRNQHDLIIVYMDYSEKEANVSKCHYQVINFVLDELTKYNDHGYTKSSKQEFDDAYTKALKIINSSTLKNGIGQNI